MVGIDFKVGEVDSSFGKGKVDIVSKLPSNFEEAVNQLVRRHCVPDETIYGDSPDLKNDPVEAARHVRLENYPSDPDQMPPDQTLLIAAAKVQTAKETLELTPPQQEGFDGLGQNILGLESCIDGGMKFTPTEEEALKARGFYLGLASGIDSSPRPKPIVGKIVKRVVPSLLVLEMAVSCNQLPVVPIAVISSGSTETATLSATATETATPTSTPEPTLTPTPEFTTLESLGDVNSDLTSDQITKLEGILKNSPNIGLWNENKRYDGRDNSWEISFVSSGEILDLQERPLIIQLSETEKMQVFVAVKGYYLDSQGKAQEMIVPLAAQMPDGKMFRYGWSGHFESWVSGDDISKEIEENGGQWLKKGGRFGVITMTNAQIIANNFDKVGPNDYINYPHLYMVGTWVYKYNSFYDKGIQVFMETGDGMRFIIPYQLISILNDVDLSSLEQ